MEAQFLVSDDSFTHSLLLIVVIVCVVLFVFSAFAGAALASLSRARVQRLAERDAQASRAIVDFAERPSFYTTTTTIIALASLVGVTVGATKLVAEASLAASAVVVWAIVFLGALLFGWVIPRSVSAA